MYRYLFEPLLPVLWVYTQDGRLLVSMKLTNGPAHSGPGLYEVQHSRQHPGILSGLFFSDLFPAPGIVSPPWLSEYGNIPREAID